jgi:hypothetical protein
LPILCILCRHRHKMHYANFRIMPTYRFGPAAWMTTAAMKLA